MEEQITQEQWERFEAWLYEFGYKHEAKKVVELETAMRSAMGNLEHTVRLLGNVETPAYCNDLHGAVTATLNAIDCLQIALPEDEL